jgi:DNA repair protein RecO (recombination protein O)
MKFRAYSSQAIVLKRKDYGEADRVITLFSLDQGKVTFIAKGVRRLTSRKRSSLEVFSHIEFLAHEHQGMDVLVETRILQDFSLLRTSLPRAAAGYFALETIDKLFQTHKANPEVFSLLLTYLDRISSGVSLKKTRERFITDLLVILGFWNPERQLSNPDIFLQSVLERPLSTLRVGPKMTQ